MIKLTPPIDRQEIDDIIEKKLLDDEISHLKFSFKFFVIFFIIYWLLQ